MSDISVKAKVTGRTAYPVVPDPDNPIILQIDGKLTPVLDISATGFSMQSEFISSGRRYPFNLDLPTAKKSIGGYVDVLPESKGEPTRCLFVNLLPEEEDALHQYVLVRQKAAIRAIRAVKSGR
ncbi:MAG: hypothetical protein KTR32_17865 [Granulosicoccus sp.]|nr:hypothetical protein [Granulosicoccus sp.]